MSKIDACRILKSEESQKERKTFLILTLLEITRGEGFKHTVKL